MPAGAIPFPFGVCRICKDRATGLHYGVATCEGCKGFFKRSITRGDKYKCFFGGDCDVTPKNRNRCKSCRFRLCLETGMSVEAVRMGRIPKVEKEKALVAFYQGGADYTNMELKVNQKESGQYDFQLDSKEDAPLSDKETFGKMGLRFDPQDRNGNENEASCSTDVYSYPQPNLGAHHVKEENSSSDREKFSHEIPFKSGHEHQETFSSSSLPNRHSQHATETLHSRLPFTVPSQHATESLHNRLPSMTPSKHTTETLPSRLTSMTPSQHATDTLHSTLPSMTPSQHATETLHSRLPIVTVTSDSIKQESEGSNGPYNLISDQNPRSQCFAIPKQLKTSHSAEKSACTPELTAEKGEKHELTFDYSQEPALKHQRIQSGRLSETVHSFSHTSKPFPYDENNLLQSNNYAFEHSRTNNNNVDHMTDNGSMNHVPSSMTLSSATSYSSFSHQSSVTGQVDMLSLDNKCPLPIRSTDHHFNFTANDASMQNRQTTMRRSSMSDIDLSTPQLDMGSSSVRNNESAPRSNPVAIIPDNQLSYDSLLSYPQKSPTPSSWDGSTASTQRSRYSPALIKVLIDQLIDSTEGVNVSAKLKQRFEQTHTDQNMVSKVLHLINEVSAKKKTSGLAFSRSLSTDNSTNSIDLALTNLPDNRLEGMQRFLKDVDMFSQKDNLHVKLEKKVSQGLNNSFENLDIYKQRSSHVPEWSQGKLEIDLSRTPTENRQTNNLISSSISYSSERRSDSLQLQNVQRSYSGNHVVTSSGETLEKNKRNRHILKTLDGMNLAEKILNRLKPEHREKLRLYRNGQIQIRIMSNSDADVKEVYGKIISNIPLLNERILGFCENVPGFKDLLKEDKDTMMKIAYYDIWMLSFAEYFYDNESWMILTSGEIYSAAAMRKILNDEMVDTILGFAFEFNALNLTDLEISILCAVQLTATDNVELVDKPFVQKLHSHMLDVLAFEVKRNHEDNHARLLIDIFRIMPLLAVVNNLQRKIISSYSVNRFQEEEDPENAKQ